MMPWTHAFVSYIAFSLSSHAVSRTSPTTRETVLVVFGALLPDLIDKPLAWQFGVLQGGRTLGHSIFTATLLSLCVGVLAVLRRQPRLGLAFAAGYLLHLPGDLLPIYLRTGEFGIEILLWPITNGGGSQGDSFLLEFRGNFVPYVRELAAAVVSGDLSGQLLLLFVSWMLAFALWVYDGMPLVRDGYHWIRRTFAPKV